MNNEAWTQIVSSEVCIDLVSLIFNLEVIALTCELKGEDRGRLRKHEKREGWGSEVEVLPNASGVWASEIREEPSFSGARISATAFREIREQCQRLTQLSRQESALFFFLFFSLQAV